MKALLVMALVVRNFICSAQIPTLGHVDPKKFIDQVEIFVGPSLHFPDDNGFYSRIERETDGQSRGKYKAQAGYMAGASLIHSMGELFQVHASLAWDRKGYLAESIVSGSGNDIYKNIGDVRNDYLSGVLALDFFIPNSSKFYISSGCFYSHLLKSLTQETLYVNGKATQVSFIKDNPEIRKSHVGILFAVSYSWQLNQKDKLGLRLQGNYGLVDVVNVNGLVVDMNSLNLQITFRRNSKPK